MIREECATLLAYLCQRLGLRLLERSLAVNEASGCADGIARSPENFRAWLRIGVSIEMAVATHNGSLDCTCPSVAEKCGA